MNNEKVDIIGLVFTENTTDSGSPIHLVVLITMQSHEYYVHIIFSAVQHLDPYKAPGSGSITSLIVKKCATELFAILYINLCNCFYRHAHKSKCRQAEERGC